MNIEWRIERVKGQHHIEYHTIIGCPIKFYRELFSVFTLYSSSIFFSAYSVHRSRDGISEESWFLALAECKNHFQINFLPFRWSHNNNGMVLVNN